MSEATHCDRPGCDTWSRNPKGHGFLAIYWRGDWGGRMDFCSWDCILKYAAAKAPLEVIGNDLAS